MRLCAGFIVLVIILSGYLADRKRKRQATKGPEFVPTFPILQVDDTTYWGLNSGTISSIDGKSVFTEAEFEMAVPDMDRSKEGFVLFWYTPDNGAATSTLGSDKKHHFVQGYLSNYKPFDTDKLWIPLQTIAMRKTYMYDHDQYNGFIEIWQYSIEAYSNTRGDCQDHSIILCDWLNALGYEARVACGTHKTEGHAWVVLYLGGKELILEATQKRFLSGNGHYPLASTLPDYKPMFMFDHDFHYLPETEGERSHAKSKWVKSSKYTRRSAI